jgi:hypothetical protein
MNFEEEVSKWESHDEWMFASREAERLFFFEAGRQQGSQETVRECESYLRSAKYISAANFLRIHLAQHFGGE